MLYFNTNKPHSFFCRIPVVLENRRSSQGGGVRTPCTLPLDPPLELCYYSTGLDVKICLRARKVSGPFEKTDPRSGLKELNTFTEAECIGGHGF